MLSMLRLIFGLSAGLATIAHMLIGVFVCQIIYNNKSTGKIPPTGFIGGLVISVLLMQQSRLVSDGMMLVVSWLGVVLNTEYLIFYYSWSKPEAKEKLIWILAKVAFCLALLLLYSTMEDQTKVASRFGAIVTLVMLGFTAFPLLELPRIMESKSTEGLPFPMILSGFFVSLLWLVYSMLYWNWILVIQNGIALVVCGVQLSLFYIYPDGSAKSNKSAERIPRLLQAQ